MTSLQESQAQLQHTQGALTEQHEKTLRLNQKVIALRRLHRRAHLNQEGQTTTTSQLHQEALMELDQGDEEQDEGDGKNETLSKSKIFSYQTPGLEIMQCKYRVAVTEVVELKAEVKALQDKLAQCAEGAADEKPRPNDQLQKLEKQVASLDKSCHEGQEKVSTILTVSDQIEYQIVTEIEHLFSLFSDFQSGVRVAGNSDSSRREPGGFECSSGRVSDAQ